MKLIEFTDFIKEIYSFFRYKKPPTNDEIEDWLNEVHNIQSEALPWILANIKTKKDTLPRNLPRTLNDQWYEYLNAHPEKFTTAEEYADYDCPDCHGVGILHFKAHDPTNKRRYIYTAICATCQASNKKFGSILHIGGNVARKTESGAVIQDGPYIPPMMHLTKEQIEFKGYEFLESENKYAKKLETAAKEG